MTVRDLHPPLIAPHERFQHVSGQRGKRLFSDDQSICKTRSYATGLSLMQHPELLHERFEAPHPSVRSGVATAALVVQPPLRTHKLSDVGQLQGRFPVPVDDLQLWNPCYAALTPPLMPLVFTQHAHCVANPTGAGTSIL